MDRRREGWKEEGQSLDISITRITTDSSLDSVQINASINACWLSDFDGYYQCYCRFHRFSYGSASWPLAMLLVLLGPSLSGWPWRKHRSKPECACIHCCCCCNYDHHFLWNVSHGFNKTLDITWKLTGMVDVPQLSDRTQH